MKADLAHLLQKESIQVRLAHKLVVTSILTVKRQAPCLRFLPKTHFSRHVSLGKTEQTLARTGGVG